MKKIILFLLLSLPLIGYSQSRKVSMSHADAYFEVEDYHNALLNYQKALSDSSGLSFMIFPYETQVSKQKLKDKALEIDSSKTVPVKDYLEHQIAMCYLKTYDYKRAVEHFSVTNTYASYPEDVYNYAVSQMNVNEHEAAISTFERYIQSDNYSDSLLRSAQLLITGCYYALDKDNVKTEVIIAKADSTVFNKGSSSFAPMYFGSEDRILFTSARAGGVILDPEKQNSEFLCDLYWTESTGDNQWSEATNFGRPLNTAQHDASGSFSPRNIIYYTRWNDENRKDQNIYLARMVDFKFYESFKLPESVNVPGYKSINPFVSMDGLTLYFSSNRPGGQGGLDLWKIALDEIGNVTGEAVNLGRPVNSELDEVSPFFHEVSSTLFFSSNGHNSIGGLDIFKSQYNKQNKAFEDPINMGMPINSSKDDSYIIWDQLLRKGFFASDREDCEVGHCYNIYEVTNEPINIVLEGYVYNSETNEIIPDAELIFKDIEFVFKPFTLKSDENGYYRAELGQNQEVFIKAQKPTFFADAASVNTKPITESTLLRQDFHLRPIPKDEIEIDGIEYDFNSANLRPESEAKLDILFEFLELNSNLIVEINSNTDFRGSDQYNQKLSDRRAKSCVDYLIKKGISKDRLKAVGYGESVPNYLKDENKKPILDENNQRIYLTEDFINAAATEELKEDYHQRNRRTAFKVVGEGFELKSE